MNFKYDVNWKSHWEENVSYSEETVNRITTET